MSKDKPNKDQFTFVNEHIEDNFLEDDSNQNIKVDETSRKKHPEELKQASKKEKRKKVLTAVISMSIISLILIAIGLLWQGAFNLLAIQNALTLAFGIEFLFAWVMFVYNKNVLSSLIHGTKSFLLMVVGKRTKLDYYHYLKHVEENPIPKIYISVLFISSAVLFVPMIILLFILL